MNGTQFIGQVCAEPLFGTMNGNNSKKVPFLGLTKPLLFKQADFRTPSYDWEPC